MKFRNNFFKINGGKIMARITYFNQCVEERKELAIKKCNESIEIQGYGGRIYLKINTSTNNKQKTSILEKLRKYINGKKEKVIKLSEKEFKKKLFDNILLISWKQSIEEQRYETLWKELQPEIQKSDNIQITTIKGSINNYKDPFTLWFSSYYIKK